MRRVLVLLVTFLLPLQFAWGALAGYCQHESGAASRHFGHHEHVHKAPHSHGADQHGAAWDQDNDCGTCHAAGMAALTGTPEATPIFLADSAPVQALRPRAPSPPRAEPERPKWAGLA
jgi:hypothetical protein